MKLNQGFTLIEVVVVLAIMIFIAMFGVVVDVGVMKRDAFLDEQTKIVTLLEIARSRSMSNLGETKHGVCLVGNTYFVFEGDTCDQQEPFFANPNFNIQFPTIVFAQLSGNLYPLLSLGQELDIIITAEGRTSHIKINNAGAIHW